MEQVVVVEPAVLELMDQHQQQDLEEMEQQVQLQVLQLQE
tara:strand:- start:185 stop:304 length:120 start_codon:yes stop_codon:yes gene_type:complete